MLRHFYKKSLISGSELVEQDIMQDAQTDKPSHPFLGLLLSMISAFLVGGSFILQKKALIKSTSELSLKGKVICWFIMQLYRLLHRLNFGYPLPRSTRLAYFHL